MRWQMWAWISLLQVMLGDIQGDLTGLKCQPWDSKPNPSCNGSSTRFPSFVFVFLQQFVQGRFPVDGGEVAFGLLR